MYPDCTVLNLAQAVELAVKAALVERNIPIYEKGGRTLNTFDALACLAKQWDVERIDFHARVELLIDERNAIQHRYGNVDDVGLDYHMETAFGVLRQVLEREFDTVLDSWVRDTLDPAIWKKIRFVQEPKPDLESASAEVPIDHGPQEPKPDLEAPSGALQPERSPTLDFVDGFARFERSIRALLRPYLEEGQRFEGSTLDLTIKALANAPNPPVSLIPKLPRVYKLRNQTIHGDQVPAEDAVDSALKILDEALKALAEVPSDILERAWRASIRGVKGTRLPTRQEEAQEEFQAEPPPEPA